MRDIINDFRKKKLKLRPVSYLSGYHDPQAVPHGYIWSPHLVPKPRGHYLNFYNNTAFKLILCVRRDE